MSGVSSCEIILRGTDPERSASVLVEHRGSELTALLEAVGMLLLPRRWQLDEITEQARAVRDLFRALGLDHAGEQDEIRRHLAHLAEHLLHHHPSEAADAAAAGLLKHDMLADSVAILVAEVLRLLNQHDTWCTAVAEHDQWCPDRDARRSRPADETAGS